MGVIYKADGTVRHDFGSYNVGAKLRRTLMGDDYITLPFVLSEPIEFELGDYHDVWFGEYVYGRYELVDKYKPEYDTATATYKYELRLDATYMKWRNKILKYNPQTGGSELSFSLTSKISIHASIVKENLKRLGYKYNGIDYDVTYDDTVDTDAAKLVAYDSINIIDALTSMAKAFEVEWWVTDNIIHFGTCQASDSVAEIPFVLGDNISQMSKSSNGEEYITKLFVFGSERNLPRKYKEDSAPDLTKSAIVQRRLMLPTAAEMTAIEQGMTDGKLSEVMAERGYSLNTDGSITVDGQGTEQLVEGVLVTDDIYPKTDCVVGEIETYTDTVIDEDGTETTYTYYRVKDTSGLDFDDSWILDGQTLHMIFSSGRLNGMEFECQYVDSGSSFAPYYEIVMNETYGRPLPDTILCPQEGDKFALTNWDSSKLTETGLIPRASYELLRNGIEYLDKSKIDPNTYSCTEDCFEDTFDYRDLGDRVSIVNPSYFPNGRSSRIIGMEINLDLPYDHPVWQCAEKVGYVFQSHVESTESLTFNGKTYENSGTGSSVYLIRLNDRTRPTDSNTFSAKRILNDFLRRNSPDTAAGKITFAAGLDAREPSTMNGLTNEGELVQNGDVTIGENNSSDEPVMKSGNFNRGTAGWELTHLGNMEVESLTVRSFLQVMVLLINRQQAQEGDTIFSDNDQITAVEYHEASDTYILTLKEKWEGYFTAQRTGHIVKGIINTLAAKQAGVSDYSDTDTEYQESDGKNLYYTSWMQVQGVGTDDGLEKNQIRVALYGDTAVPAQKNFPPCVNMAIARWGCYLSPEEPDITAGEKKRRERAQTLFMVSVTDGRIMKLTGVDKPILETWNYGTTLGLLPDFINDWTEVKSRLWPNRDYLYAQGIVVGDFIKVNIEGKPLINFVNCGMWVDGSTLATPTPGNGIYLVNEYNDVSLQWETHDVYWLGCRWRALQHIPVTIGGQPTYPAPKWNSIYWQMIEGNDNLSLELYSTNGNAFRVGYVNTEIVPTLFYGNMDITSDIPDNEGDWWWTRETESGKTTADESWDANHKTTRILTLNNDQMPQAWSRTNRAIFTCHVRVNDGRNETIIDNQVTV